MMKRRYLIVLCSLFLAFSLAACGGGGTSTGNDNSVGESESQGESSSEVSSQTSETNEEANTGSVQEEAQELSSTEAKSARPTLDLASLYIYEWNEAGDKPCVSGNQDLVRVSEESRDQYGSLAASLDKDKKKLKKRTKKEVKDIVKNCKKYPEELETWPEGFRLEGNIYARRCDRRVVSLMGYNYSFTGGAHGLSVYSSYNYDSSNGKELTLDDVVTDRAKLLTALKDQLLARYPKDTFFEDMEKSLETMVMGKDEYPLIWTLDPQGFTAYFNPYELGPYAAGPLSATLFYKDWEGLFAENYLPEEGDGYICGMPMYVPFTMDVDQDGIGNDISVSISKDEDSNAITSFTVAVDDKDLTIDEVYCYNIAPKVVLTGDGHAFLYVSCTTDNDFVNMYIFDLSSGSPVSMSSVTLSEPMVEQNEGDIYYCRLLTDPSRMEFSNRFDILSTYSGKKIYSVTDNPLPESEDPYYMITRDINLVLAEELIVPLLDENGEICDSKTLKKGDTIKLYRTDGQTFVDALLSDGSMVRLLVTGTYPQKINGKDADKIFEQLFYAG